MATTESLLQEERAAEEALRQAYSHESPEPGDSEDADVKMGEQATSDQDASSPAIDDGRRQQDVRADVQRALDEASYWRDRCGQLQEQLNAIVQTRAAASDQPEIPPVLTDYLGEEAAKAVVDLLAHQKREMDERFGQVAHLSRQSAEQAFWAQVRQAFPNYKEMESDAALNRWLAGSWPGSRQTRLQQAHALAQSLDADGFIGLLRSYSPTSASTKPSLPSPTPRRAAGSGTPPESKPNLSRDDLGNYGARIINLKSQGRHQEAAALEKEFDAAVRDRRISA